jgi:hypothetical protein
MGLDRGADFFERSARVQLAAERFGYLRGECLSGIQVIGVQLDCLLGPPLVVPTAEVSSVRRTNVFQP